MEQGGGLFEAIALLDKHLKVSVLADTLAAIAATPLSAQWPAADAVRWMLVLGSFRSGELAEQLLERCSAQWLFPRLLLLARLCRRRGRGLVPHKLATAIRQSALGVQSAAGPTPDFLELHAGTADIGVRELGELMAAIHFAGFPGATIKKLVSGNGCWPTEALLRRHSMLASDVFGALVLNEVRESQKWLLADRAKLWGVDAVSRVPYGAGTVLLSVIDGERHLPIVRAGSSLLTVYSTPGPAAAVADQSSGAPPFRSYQTRIWINEAGHLPMISTAVLMLRPLLDV